MLTRSRTVELDPSSLLQAFRSHTLPKPDWTHEAHVVVCWATLQEMDADTDGDGLMEEVCSVPVSSQFDESGTTAVPPAGETGGALALRVAPNPFFGASAVTFTLPRAGHLELGVYDVNGRLVRMLQRGTAAAGTHSLDWDGRDPQGNRVPAGVYFVRLDAPGSQLKSKLVKLR